MVRALQLVNSIARATGYHDISLQCSVNLVRGLLSLNQPQVAMTIAETLSKELKLPADISKKSLNIAALFIAKAEVHLMLREVILTLISLNQLWIWFNFQTAEAGAIAEQLTELFEGLQSNARTKEILLFESQYQLMMYQLRLLTANQNCSLSHMTVGMRSVFKVIVHLTSGDGASGKLLSLQFDTKIEIWNNLHVVLNWINPYQFSLRTHPLCVPCFLPSYLLETPFSSWEMNQWRGHVLWEECASHKRLDCHEGNWLSYAAMWFYGFFCLSGWLNFTWSWPNWICFAIELEELRLISVEQSLFWPRS